MKIMKVEILGVTLEAALLNPKVAHRFEDGIKEVINIAKKSSECESSAQGIEMQCNAVINFIDNIFGSDSAKKILGDETDLLTCLDAWGELMDVYATQVNPLLEEYRDRALERYQKMQAMKNAG